MAVAVAAALPHPLSPVGGAAAGVAGGEGGRLPDLLEGAAAAAEAAAAHLVHWARMQVPLAVASRVVSPVRVSRWRL